MIILIFSPQLMFAQTETTGSTDTILPQGPVLTPQPGDEELTSVSVGELRFALWYKEMYGVARDLSISQEEMIKRLIEDKKTLEDKNTKEVTTWKVVSGVLAVVAVGTITLAILK
jgi:hypothetical protein